MKSRTLNQSDQLFQHPLFYLYIFLSGSLRTKLNFIKMNEGEERFEFAVPWFLLYHPEGDVFTHIRLMLSNLPAGAGTTLIWAVLLHDIAKPVTQTHADGRIRFLGHETVGAEMTLEIMNRLRFPKVDSAAVKTCVRHHMQLKEAQKMRPATLRKLFLRATFPEELALHRLDSLASSGQLENYEFLRTKFAEFQNQPEMQQPLVDGAALSALGQAPVPSRPETGRRLAPARACRPRAPRSHPAQAAGKAARRRGSRPGGRGRSRRRRRAAA